MSNDSNNPLANQDPFIEQEIPPGVDRRTFLMRSAVVGATAVMLGRSVSAETTEAGLALSVVLC